MKETKKSDTTAYILCHKCDTEDKQKKNADIFCLSVVVEQRKGKKLRLIVSSWQWRFKKIRHIVI